MPTTKKTAAPKAATKKAPAKKKAAPKKAAPKKAAPKKAPAKKAAPKPAPAPEPAPKRRSVYLLTNSGEHTLHFVGDKDFESPMNVIKSAPSSSGGSRSITTYYIGDYGFRTVKKCVVTEH